MSQSMPEMTPELRAALDTAKQRIKVDSYYTKAMNSGVKGRTQGLWSGTLMGLLSGAFVGGIVTLALPTAIVGLSAWTVIAGLASIGATIGATGGMLIGAPAGVVSGVLAEKERREKAEKLEQEVLASPQKQQELIEAYRADPVVQKDDTIEETFKTSKTSKSAWAKIIDFKTVLAAAAICAAVGAVLCMGAFAIAPAAVGGVGFGYGALVMHSLGGAALLGGTMGAAMGSLFGVAFPPIFANLTQTVADLLSFKMVHGKSGFERIKTAEEMEQEAVQNYNMSTNSSLKPVVNSRQNATDLQPTTQVRTIDLSERLAPQQHQLSA